MKNSNGQFNEFVFSEFEKAMADRFDFKQCKRSDGTIYGVPNDSDCAQKGSREVSPSQGNGPMLAMRAKMAKSPEKFEKDVLSKLGTSGLDKLAHALKNTGDPTDKKIAQLAEKRAKAIRAQEGSSAKPASAKPSRASEVNRIAARVKKEGAEMVMSDEFMKLKGKGYSDGEIRKMMEEAWNISRGAKKPLQEEAPKKEAPKKEAPKKAASTSTPKWTRSTALREAREAGAQYRRDVDQGYMKPSQARQEVKLYAAELAAQSGGTVTRGELQKAMTEALWMGR